MKITLDLTKLVEEGKLTVAEAARLKELAAHDTGSLAINILVGFGVVAVAAGAVALVPTPFTAVILGAILAGAGYMIGRSPVWDILGQICLVLGALMFCGGVIALGQGSLASMLIVTAVLAAGSILARSSLLMAGAVLALGACLGAQTSYRHAVYSLAIYEPLLTIVVFSALALAAYQVSKRLTSAYERIAITAARTSVFMVNFGFWIGSLWGDRLLLIRSLLRNDPAILGEFASRSALLVPAWVFIIGWAVALAAVGTWGTMVNRRWVVNVAAVFGAIHFYTQWFGRLGPGPFSIMMAGLLMLAFAIALWSFNRRKLSAA